MLSAPFAIGIIASAIRASGAPPSGGNPLFSNVVALLKFNGTNGSTTYVDSSSLAGSYSRTGTGTISTAQSRFGGASGEFNGNTSVSRAAATAIDLPGQFTIEGFVYPRSHASTPLLMSRQSANGQIQQIRLRTSGELEVVFGNGGSFNSSFGGSVPLNTWTHIAVTRDAGNTIRGFVNGGLVLSAVNSLSYSGPERLHFGSFMALSNWFNGFLDEWRITKGQALYTAAFTPPSNEFPTS